MWIYIYMYDYVYVYIYIESNINIYIYAGAQRFGGPLEQHAEDSRFKILRKNFLDPDPCGFKILRKTSWIPGLKPWQAKFGRRIWIQDVFFPQNLESRGGKSEGKLDSKSFLLESWIQRGYTPKNIIIQILHACILLTILDSKSKNWMIRI